MGSWKHLQSPITDIVGYKLTAEKQAGGAYDDWRIYVLVQIFAMLSFLNYKAMYVKHYV